MWVTYLVTFPDTTKHISYSGQFLMVKVACLLMLLGAAKQTLPYASLFGDRDTYLETFPGNAKHNSLIDSVIDIGGHLPNKVFCVPQAHSLFCIKPW